MRTAVAVLSCLSWSSIAQCEDAFQTWIADPHRRVFYGSFGRDLETKLVELEAAVATGDG